MDFKGVNKVLNLTPHECCVMMNDTFKRYPTSGNVVRLKSKCRPCGFVDGVPVHSCIEGEPMGLPEPEEGTIYIVSSVVAKKVKRKDVVCPDTSDDGVIKDGSGRIVAVRRFQCFLE